MNVLFENVDFDYTKKNIEKHMDVSNLQTYFPIIDNYIDNSEYEEDAHLILKSRFILKGLIENNTEDFTQKQSPYIKTFYNSKVYDRFSKKTIEKNIFIKKNPIVDVLGYSMNQYSLSNHVLPNITSCITSEYINNYNNEAYIDSFFTFIGSKLTETRRCPTFPLFYGTYNCVSNNLKFDISEEYYDVMSNPDFENNINKKFVIEEVEIEDEPYEDHVFELIETDMEVDVLELDQLYQDNQSTLEGLPSMEELPDTLETTNISNIDITQLDSLDDLSDLEETDDTFKYLNVKNKKKVLKENGTNEIKDDIKKYLNKVSKLPVGEIYLNSIDKDGTGMGLDFSILDFLPKNNNKSIIMSGGSGNSTHIANGLKNNSIDAVATANLLNFVGDGLLKARTELLKKNFNLPTWNANIIKKLKNKIK